MPIAKKIKNYFLRGLAVLLPTILTIWVFVWGYQFIQKNISIHVNRGIVRLIMFVQSESGPTKEVLDEVWLHGPGAIAGFVIALLAVCIIGALLASVVGKTLWKMIETFIMNTPFLKQVYPYIKQVTDFLFTQNGSEKLSFSKVVAVEYPKKDVWSVGLVTGEGLKKVVEKQEKEFLTVFIPSSPTPLTGFTIIAQKDSTIDLDMTIDEAFRFVASGGVITPQNRNYKTWEKTKVDVKKK
ncbi:MAG: DUF502 domain-containing protein [Sedimentisphaerales bacterium]|jgi:uncharacterized membrane protein|nr:DUF502 domain-containing protein [Sedimentisphaerales bacterium]